MFIRIITLSLACMLPLSAAARPATADHGTDRFVAGGRVRVTEPVAGDLIAAGGKVAVDAAVSGDAIVAGGDVRIDGTIGQSLYVGGGQVAIDGTVGRNARIAGGRVEIGPKAVVSGGLSIAGGRVDLEGTVKGYVQATGGRVSIDGAVDGDVVARSGTVELGPHARIGGKLRYASGHDVRRDPAAQVAGGIETLSATRRGADSERRAVSHAGRWLWTAGVVLTAIVLVAALPGFTARAAKTLHDRAGMSLLLGFVALVCIPIGALVLLVTVIGIPLAVIALLLYAVLLIVGYTMTGVAAGDWLLARYRAADAARTGWRILAAGVAVLVIALLARVPGVGGLVSFAALIAGLGAVVLQARRRDPAAAAPAVSA